MARKLAQETPGAFLANQFGNPANPTAHRTTTAPEIWEQMQGNIDAVVAGVGSGGTLTGLAEFFKSKDPSICMVAADPEGSIISDAVLKGEYNYDGGSWLVEGVGEDFIPDTFEVSLMDDAETVSDKEAFDAFQLICKTEGILIAFEPAFAVAHGIKLAKKMGKDKILVLNRLFFLFCGNSFINLDFFCKRFSRFWSVKINFNIISSFLLI